MTNYDNGANLERAIINRYKDYCACIRSAGSRGFSDVTIFFPTSSRGIWSIQCKIYKMTPKERKDAITKFRVYKNTLKANNVKCWLVERYERQEHWTNVTKLVYHD